MVMSCVQSQPIGHCAGAQAKFFLTQHLAFHPEVGASGRSHHSGETCHEGDYISQVPFLEKPKHKLLLPWTPPQHCSDGSWGRREKPVVFSLALFSEFSWQRPLSRS